MYRLIVLVLGVRVVIGTSPGCIRLDYMILKRVFSHSRGLCHVIWNMSITFRLSVFCHTVTCFFPGPVGFIGYRDSLSTAFI